VCVPNEAEKREANERNECNYAFSRCLQEDNFYSAGIRISELEEEDAGATFTLVVYSTFNTRQVNGTFTVRVPEFEDDGNPLRIHSSFCACVICRSPSSNCGVNTID